MLSGIFEWENGRWNRALTSMERDHLWASGGGTDYPFS